MSQFNILITGADGQLGRMFAYMAHQYTVYNFTFVGRSTLDVTSLADWMDVAQKKWDYIIHCAAYTAVDKAESDKTVCFDINAKACQNIVDVFKNTSTHIIYFSTDYVYHNNVRRPLIEEDITSPKNTYASSKLEGETILRDSGLQVLILRISWVYGPFGHNFPRTISMLLETKPSLNIICNQYGTPTHTEEIVLHTLEIIKKHSADPTQYESRFNDTYNLSPEGITTWYHLALKINQSLNLPTVIHPIPTSDYPAPALRPLWSILNKAKIKKAWEIDITHWTHYFDKFLAEDIQE